VSVDLRNLITDVAREEGGERSAGGTAQVGEIVGIMGRRWRAMPLWRAMQEFMAVRSRAGKTTGDDDDD